MNEETIHRTEKLKWMIEKGYTADIDNGIVFGLKGQQVGYIDGNGYLSIRIKFEDKKYHIKAHQFIYYYANGIVAEMIDHINQDKLDNKITNLREATNQINQWNKSNTTKGYHWNKLANKWQAEIVVDKEKIYLGIFNNEDDAKNAYLKAKKRFHII